MQAGRQASKSGVHGVEWSGVEKWSGVDRVEQAHHAGRQAGRQASRQTHTSTGTSGKPNDVVASRFRLAEFRGVPGISVGSTAMKRTRAAHLALALGALAPASVAFSWELQELMDEQAGRQASRQAGI